MSINMTTDHPQNVTMNGMSRPSSRPLMFAPAPRRPAALPAPEPSSAHTASKDHNHWYYPGRGYESDDDDAPPVAFTGNWGRKSERGARWMRQGKLAAWGPGVEDWEEEDRARKRVKLMMPEEPLSPTPPHLPHLRPLSPPIMAPYPLPPTDHLNYTSFVMDRAVTYSFRSPLLEDLEHATNGLIEGEAELKRAFGKLWQVLSEDPDHMRGAETIVPKREEEEEEEENEEARKLARAPDLTPSVHKIFLVPYPMSDPLEFEPSHFAPPELQLETLDKSLATLRELQDDGREYTECLEEIREGLGDIRAQRDAVWKIVRTSAMKELQTMAAMEADVR